MGETLKSKFDSFFEKPTVIAFLKLGVEFNLDLARFLGAKMCLLIIAILLPPFWLMGISHKYHGFQAWEITFVLLPCVQALAVLVICTLNKNWVGSIIKVGLLFSLYCAIGHHFVVNFGWEALSLPKLSLGYSLAAPLFLLSLGIIFSLFVFWVVEYTKIILSQYKALIATLSPLVVLYLIIDVVFAGIYRAIQFYDPKSFGDKALNGFFDPIYFSTVTITTLGFGDISPSSDLCKVLVSSEALIGVLLISVIIGFSISVALQFEEFQREKPKV